MTLRLCAAVDKPARVSGQIAVELREKAAGGTIVPIANRLYAEFLGTAWLVLGGCGSAVLAAAFPQLGIGFAGVALAFGLTVLTMVYALGPVSGGHFNPAVTVGLAFSRSLPLERGRAVRDCPGAGRHRRRGDPLCRGHRQGRRRHRQLRHQRLWRALARQVRPARRLGHRGRHDLRLRHGDRGRHRPARPSPRRRGWRSDSASP